MMNIPQAILFSALSNDIRLRCLFLVSSIDEVCVCDIVETLRLTQPTASKALHCLKSAGLVSDRKVANWNYYRMNPGMPDWKKTIVDVTVRELEMTGQVLADQKRIKKLAVRPCAVACP
jgi:ArsR family transcriptional regulator, arsenate/arsenite/antimonite-responsive transcriptional repressor